MTEADFEESRSHLWHYVLRNGVQRKLLPDVEWNQFRSQVEKLVPNNAQFPVLDLHASGAQEAVELWLNGNDHAQPVERSVAQLLSDADRIDFLRRRANRSPTDEEIIDWVNTCTQVFLQKMAPGAQPRSQEFWQCFFNIDKFLCELECGSKSFWNYFEQVI